MFRLIVFIMIIFNLYANSFSYKLLNPIDEVKNKCNAKEILYLKQINESSLLFHQMIPNFKGSWVSDDPIDDKRGVVIFLNDENDEKRYLVPQYYKWSHAYPYEITTYGFFFYQDYIDVFYKETNILISSYEENIKIVDSSLSLKTIDNDENETLYNLDYNFYFNYDNKYALFSSNNKIEIIDFSKFKNVEEFIAAPEEEYFDIRIINFDD